MEYVNSAKRCGIYSYLLHYLLNKNLSLNLKIKKTLVIQS
jgi:hypothetical protein